MMITDNIFLSLAIKCTILSLCRGPNVEVGAYFFVPIFVALNTVTGLVLFAPSLIANITDFSRNNTPWDFFKRSTQACSHIIV